VPDSHARVVVQRNGWPKDSHGRCERDGGIHCRGEFKSQPGSITLELQVECRDLVELRRTCPALRGLPGTDPNLKCGHVREACSESGGFLECMHPRYIDSPAGGLGLDPYAGRPGRQRRRVRSHGFTVTAAPYFMRDSNCFAITIRWT
jgi:hypothetical protein